MQFPEPKISAKNYTGESQTTEFDSRFSLVIFEGQKVWGKKKFAKNG